MQRDKISAKKQRANANDDAALASMVHAILSTDTLHGKVRTLADMTRDEIAMMIKLYGPLSPNAAVKRK